MQNSKVHSLCKMQTFEYQNTKHLYGYGNHDVLKGWMSHSLSMNWQSYAEGDFLPLPQNRGSADKKMQVELISCKVFMLVAAFSLTSLQQKW